MFKIFILSEWYEFVHRFFLTGKVFTSMVQFFVHTPSIFLSLYKSRAILNNSALALVRSSLTYTFLYSSWFFSLNLAMYNLFFRSLFWSLTMVRGVEFGLLLFGIVNMPLMSSFVKVTSMAFANLISSFLPCHLVPLFLDDSVCLTCFL